MTTQATTDPQAQASAEYADAALAVPSAVVQPPSPESVIEPRISSPEARALRGPARFVLRALVLLILVGFLAYILQEGMRAAFMANPGLNGLIIGVMMVGVLMALAEFWRMGRAAKVGRAVQQGESFTRLSRDTIMAPLATVATRGQSASGAVEALSVRLDEGRETLRYMAGLLVFLGLLGTFWGLLETVSSIGGVIKSLRTGGESGVLFDELKSGLAAPLAGMGLSFSSSLFGIAGSLLLGFLDLQLGQSQRALRTDVEDWLAGLPVPQQADSQASLTLPLMELGEKFDQLSLALTESGGKSANAAMANLAEGIQKLVQHMRGEQQLIRDWVEAQAERERQLKAVMERLAAQHSERERG
ncbi:MAG: flagellar motor protein MotA [Bosea sp. (in: a-proteobacteria)]